MKEFIYLDYAATTPVDDTALCAALPYMKEIFFNPSSAHSAGQMASSALEQARGRCARVLNASPNEIYFTSGGTEAINLAVHSAPKDKKHIVVSAIEHEAVIAAAERLKADGYVVDYVKPNSDGLITPDALSAVLTPDVGLVCVMTVNNITGATQPIKELAGVAHNVGALFFTDAVQAVNAVRMDVADMGVDMLAVSGHKFYAQKGVGLLYAKKGVKLTPLLVGGEQEKGVRAGTVDVASAVGMSVALENAQNGVEAYCENAAAVMRELLNGLDIGRPVVCGKQTPDIISVVFDGLNGGRLAVALSLAGVCCSVGSACSAGSATPPRALVEMGVDGASSSVRFSLGKYSTNEHAKAAARIINRTVKNLKSHGN